MADAQLRLQHSDSETEQSSVSATAPRVGDNGQKEKEREKRANTRTPRASKKDLDALSGKVDKLFGLFERFSESAVSDRHRPHILDLDSAASDRHRPDLQTDTARQRPENNVNRQSGQDDSFLHRNYTATNPSEDDVLSIQPGQKEVVDLLGSDEDSRSISEEHLANRFSKYTSKPRMLAEMFGEDAVVSSSKDRAGISLDTAQKEVLKGSWRTEDPDKITAFKEVYRSSFPVAEVDGDFLRVPSLDDIIDQLLIKRYGNKAATKAPSLYSQPLKSIQKLAYQGQMAARMGIVISLYTQQALGNLLALLEEKDTNLDQAIQCVRDTFAMSTKLLDQTARSGSFHHLIRRRAAMADTNLHDFKDVKSHLWNLPLTHSGVFGEGLEKKLRDRLELNKQIGDLLPEVDRKRRSNVTEDRQWKRPRFSEERTYNTTYSQYPRRRQQQSWRPTSATGPKQPKSGSNRSATVSSFRAKATSK